MKRNGPHGFSLIELLVVVAILAVLVTVSMSAFTSIGRGRSLAKGAADLAGILELSRAHAMANNTAVLVTLEPSKDNQNLLVGVFDCRPGESNPKPLQRKRALENITATTDPASLTNFRFNSRGELQNTNSVPIQKLDIVLEPPSESYHTTVTIKGLTGAISVAQPD